MGCNLAGEKWIKNTKIIDLAWTGLRISARLDNKTKQIYGLFAKFLLSVIGVYEVEKNPHIFLTIANKHIQKMNVQFDGTLNYYGTMVFASNQEQNKSYTFQYLLLQPVNSDFIVANIKEVEAHKFRCHWKLMKKSEVKNEYKIKMWISRLFYPFDISSARDSRMED